MAYKKLALSLSFGIISCGLTGCNGPDGASSGSAGSTSQCRGAYTTRDSHGDLHRWNEYAINGQCFTDNVALSHWETTSETWRKSGVTCTPQPQFQSRSLVSANNFYSFRDGRVYLDLDSSTGEYRQIILAEDHGGHPVFSRLKGCFYQRTATGVDAAYGNQLLLDSVQIASTEDFIPAEVYQYTETVSSLEAVRFDDSGNGWDYRYCPSDTVPEAFCQDLQTGDMLFFPSLSVAQKADLLAEAILIRRTFNFAKVSKPSFEHLWATVEQTRTEKGRADFKYQVSHIVDTPVAVDQSWFAFIRNQRTHMPAVTGTRIGPICFSGRRQVVLADGGNGYVSGEVCYDSALGEYHFTASP